MGTMAAVGLRTCRSWTHRTSVWPTVSSRSYAAMATVKGNQKPSNSQPAPTSSRNASPSPKIDHQPSDGKAKKSKPSPSSLESAAEQNLQAMERMRRFNKMYATADVWGTEMASLGTTTVLVSLLWYDLTNVLDAEIPYDLRPMFRSLTTKPMFSPSKFSYVSTL